MKLMTIPRWIARLSLLVMLMACTFVLSTQFSTAAHADGSCPADRPCITGLLQNDHTINMTWSGHYDNYNIILTYGNSRGQHHVDSGNSELFYSIAPYKTYTFSIEGCNTNIFGSTCS